MRSFWSSGAEYQSVMMTPPKGSAEASGMNASVSSEACQRKEFTPSVTLPLPLSMAVMYAPMVLAGLVTTVQGMRELLAVLQRPQGGGPGDGVVVE